MQAGKNISASEIFSDCSSAHPYRCVGGNGLRGYVSRYNTSGHNAIVGRQGALCGCLNLEDGNYYATEHAVVVDTYDILSPEFMYYFLTALNLNQYATATAQPGLAVSNIIEVLFPLPPYGEQARIIQSLKQLQPKLIQYEAHEGKLNILNDSISIKLKSSILQDAIQGKLVPQIESEGTAEELLTEIRVEKERLVKEGKLKKSAIANESRIFRGDDNKYYEQIGAKISEIESIFEIPESWAWVKLPYIGSSILGKTLDKGKDSGMETPYLCSINVYWCGISTTTVKTTLFSESEREKYRLNKGDLLICEGGDVGRCSIWDSETPMWYQNALHRVRLNRNISPEFIKMIVEFYKHTGIIDRMCKGVTIKHFTQSLLYSLLLPLPPKQEQERIVTEYKRLLQKL